MNKKEKLANAREYASWMGCTLKKAPGQGFDGEEYYALFKRYSCMQISSAFSLDSWNNDYFWCIHDHDVYLEHVEHYKKLIRKRELTPFVPTN